MSETKTWSVRLDPELIDRFGEVCRERDLKVQDMIRRFMSRVIERPELEHAPRFDGMEMRTQNCEELIRILDQVMATKTLQEWNKLFKETDFIYGLVATPQEVTTDPQALASGVFTEVDHPATGKTKLVSTPVNFSQNPAAVKAPAPEIGQHDEEILLELGYDWEDIGRFKDQFVIL